MNIDSAVFTLICILIFGSFFFVRFRNRQLAKSSIYWLPIDAVVTKSIIETRSRKDKDGSNNSRINESRPSISYRYEYKGQHFTGNRFSFINDWHEDYNRASYKLQGIFNGSKVTIYVNPKNKKQSVFKSGL